MTSCSEELNDVFKQYGIRGGIGATMVCSFGDDVAFYDDGIFLSIVLFFLFTILFFVVGVTFTIFSVYYSYILRIS